MHTDTDHIQHLAQLLERASEVTITVERRATGIQIFLATDNSLHGQSCPRPTMDTAIRDALGSLFLLVNFPAKSVRAGDSPWDGNAAPSRSPTAIRTSSQRDTPPEPIMGRVALWAGRLIGLGARLVTPRGAFADYVGEHPSPVESPLSARSAGPHDGVPVVIPAPE